ncbi:CHASE2 domain-containing protein [Sneathiella sp. P13V-1]|uniref:CHASE2 domain-containing protein n=1 Tax=Sneathiella sp. P13V-1 TaxID=2697366 RepID=UPI00187B782C|nr:adenylate/guanylate cyclase domain-containing protein [Sneathiella sp. P13V-1]MBE7636621.1 CHASE2 domain-containing protein [Sneathiella sp. P13V-1]
MLKRAIVKTYRLIAGSFGQKLVWAILLALLYIQYLNTPLMEGVRNRGFDLYQRIVPRVEAPINPVVVLDIDEKSLARIGQWPWSRDVLAELIEKLTRLGVVVIGFDIVFSEEDRLSPPLLAKTLRDVDDETRKKLLKMPGNDLLMAEAMKRSRVVLGGFVSNEDGVTESRTLKRLSSINYIGQNPNRFVRPAIHFVGNLPILENAAKGFANFTLDSDYDGIIRRVPLFNRVDSKLIPILGLEMLRVATGQNLLVKANENGIEGVVVARTLIPTDGFGRMWVRFSQFNPSNYISAVDVLDGTVNPERLAGKLVLVGTSATGLKDLRSSPVDPIIPGVEVHAQMLQTILTGEHLFRGDLMRAFEWFGLLFVGGTLIIVMPLLGARTTFLGLTALVAGWCATSGYLYVEKSVFLDVTYFLISTTIMFFLLVYFSFRSTEQQRGKIRSAFSHYLSPAMVDQLTEAPDQLKLGGEVKEMTFLFCDVRGFTTISEQFNNDPEGLTQLINDFLTPMTDIILKHRGTIDKYMGDCIMAFWNAPLDDPEHARHSVEAAREMIAKLGIVNTDLEQKAKTEGRQHIPIKVGVGLNTGSCVVGNMGSEQRFDYSVLGDAVNLASRLEGQCKFYGFEIIIGPDTAKAQPENSVLELDLIAVKGKSEAVKIYGCISDNMVDGEPAGLVIKNREMLAAYRERNWATAGNLASDCLSIAPALGHFYELYQERIANFQREAPDENWCGVYAPTTK